MTAAGRRGRLLAAAAGLALLLAGSLWGGDDDFPFAPFRMYATSGRPTGTVRVAELVGVDGAGRTVPVRPEAVGLRRAELEGQYSRFRDRPELLGALVRAHDGDEHLVELRLQERVRHVADRRLTGEEEVRVLARWRAGEP